MTEIDATGLSCPMPVLRLQKALRDIASGGQIRLLASDPMAAIDVPHFCQEQGHRLIASAAQDGPGDMRILCFEIEKGA
ncbi:MAG: sulfurtransferase TusA family protein [Parvibaculales bacterium]|jgi:tRNA 2-thiouridine synthesizing protein A